MDHGIEKERQDDLSKQILAISMSPELKQARPFEKADLIIGLSRTALGIEHEAHIHDLQSSDKTELLFVMRSVRDLTHRETS
ncbi:MAG: hypothetical protein ABIQ89_01920 [Candidatus Saccharimonadales bacterium]